MLALSLALSLVLGAAQSARPAQRTIRRHEIRMRGNSFAPRETSVAVGDTVVWMNTDIVRHNAVYIGLFDSDDLKGGEQFSWVPADTGLVRYQCTIHSRMRGTLRVRPAR